MKNSTLAILGVVAIGGGYLYYSNKKKKEQEEAKRIADKLKEEVKVEVKEATTTNPSKATETPKPPMVGGTKASLPPRMLEGTPFFPGRYQTDVLVSVPRPMSPKASSILNEGVKTKIVEALGQNSGVVNPKLFTKPQVGGVPFIKGKSEMDVLV